MNYYYNIMPDGNKTRNNLVYTSLVNDDQTVFCKWYFNDTDYHQGLNKVTDPAIMEEKWNREITHLKLMSDSHPGLIPEILDIDEVNKKIYLKIEGPDLWQSASTNHYCFSEVVPDWQEQILDHHRAYHELGFYKYSIHPSSYFPVNGKLKSINYFFCHPYDEETITVNKIKSHISEERFKSAEPLFEKFNVTSYDQKIPLASFMHAILLSFQSNYPKEFIDRLLSFYKFF